MKNKRSIIWISLNDEEFINLVKNSFTMREVLSYFGLEQKGGNCKTCKNRIKHLKIDTSHFLSTTEIRKKMEVTKEDFLKDLIYPSKRDRSSIKKFLIKFNLMEYECEQCGLKDEWNNKKISLQLDHINGINNDNRIENLRFLCPNCHSQTSNYAGKDRKKIYFCDKCGNKKSDKQSKMCFNCDRKRQKPEKFDWPTHSEMAKLVWEKPMINIAKDLGVSDRAIAKFCDRHKINRPTQGYFLKK